MSEISKVYNQYHDSLKTSQEDYEKRIIDHAQKLKKIYDEYLNKFVVSFVDEFSNQVKRMELKSIAERFLGTSDIHFVAIDASCEKRESENFISFYGGAYGSKGVLSLSDPGGRLRYQRWEMNKDVSMVAFVPLPPDVMEIGSEDAESGSITLMSDSEISQISSLHTKIMQLAEVYLAYSLAASSTIDTPNLILMDNWLGGILANSSFSPRNVQLKYGDFDGEEITVADMQVALAHPFKKELGNPSTKGFQQHFRIIAEAVWKENKTISHSDCDSEFSGVNFKAGARFLQGIGAGVFDEKNKSFTFNVDPRVSWTKTLRIFNNICEGLFREKSASVMIF